MTLIVMDVTLSKGRMLAESIDQEGAPAALK